MYFLFNDNDFLSLNLSREQKEDLLSSYYWRFKKLFWLARLFLSCYIQYYMIIYTMQTLSYLYWIDRNNKNHKILLMISWVGILSLFWMASSWNVESEPIMEPPIQDEYFLCQSNSIFKSCPYLLSYLCILSSIPCNIDEPPQNMAFFINYCLRSSLHLSKLV